MYGERDIDMKLQKKFFNPYGLRARLGLSLAVSAIICIAFFFIINVFFGYIFDHYYETSSFQRAQVQKQFISLQKYIRTNHISTNNLQRLKEWEKEQPVILLELYSGNTCIYNSIYDAPISSLVLDEKQELENIAELYLEDQVVTAFIYSDFTYQHNLIRTGIAIVSSLVLFIILFIRSNTKLIKYICRLNREVQILEGGNLEYNVSEEGNDEITDLARSMNRMKTSLQQQIDAEQKLHLANKQLITEMSHDLRTPLTSILLYLEILKAKRYESQDQLQDYLDKIDIKAHHMKLLSDHLFEYAMSDSTKKQLKPQYVKAAFEPAINTLLSDLRTHGFLVESDIEWNKCFVQVNTEYILRIFENIASNIEKYGQKTAEVRIDTQSTNKYYVFSIMNTYTVPSNKVESNGVGIDIIRNMMLEMDGICNVERSDTTFEITLSFPIK